MLVSYLKDFHPYAKSSWRFVATVVPAVLIIAYYCHRKKQERLLENIWPLSKKSGAYLFLLLLRSFFGCSAVLLQYYSLKYMSLADSSTVAYSSPVFVSILAYFFLGEPFGIFSFLSTLIALAGVACITRPPFITGEKLDLELVVGVCFAFMCTIFRGVAIVIVRYLKKVHYSVVLFGFGTFGMVQSLVLAWSYQVMDLPNTPIDITLTVGMGLLSCVGQICLVLALKAENAGPVALVRTCDVVFAFIWQMVFLRKIPDFYSVLGGCVVLLGVLLAAFRKYIETLDPTHSHRRWFGFVLN
ncbi:unnamed protein product [Allacma fusca]|uniref:EamA domain-containing protein n=1 Tax=Allacma fusca TaxID=39272 RepID=A0A8J2JQ46_9HEXA|nr:unnamed protein product [Allacma fusca]